MLNKIEETGSDKRTFFELLGGEENGIANIRQLVETFYDVMESDPKVAPIRAMHQPDLTSAREKLFMFLTGWTGGPQLYIERYGHPMLRARHLPFPIDASARDQWMYCMIKAMHQLEFDENLMTKLASQLYGVADFMRNQAEKN
ncbi:MAG: group II truncated hemoglobin [Methylotenera sp.]|jgi:hemoglobin|nr:group II truncated hemoglobin [Methylotenera sp.]HOY86280.1 group II truncated hemoglobin [Methylotenera sp.]HPH08430.1 group II truncated hemoglobin [Methylotenera sp.]HPM48243.1 group II truncated hemoglobin [Methylotenera sp.]HPV32526.1 group II truncated hemoglobin [Methylotenera sp.]